MSQELKLSQYVLIKEDFPIEGYYLLYSSLTRSVIVLETEIFERISNKDFKNCPKNIIEELFNQGILVSSSDNESNYIKYFIEKGKFSNPAFGAMILTTYDCNLKCEYCIETEIQGFRRENMTNDTTKDIINWIQRKIDEKFYHILELVFYGGEPLLNKDPIFQICDYFYNETLKKNLIFSFSIITNGTIELSDDELKTLTKNNLKFIQITIDGSKYIHDKRRPYKNGEGSFSDIIKNLKKFLEFTKVAVRINIDSANMEDIDNLLKCLKEEGLNNRVYIDFSPRMKSCYPSLQCDSNVLTDKAFSEFLIKKALPSAKRDGFSITRRFVDSGPCLLLSESQFVIDPVGDIYKCGGFVGKKEFSIGNVRDKKFNSKYVEFITMDRWRECIECPYVPLCGGGCAFESYVNIGDYTKRICKKQLFSKVTMEVLASSLDTEKIIDCLKQQKDSNGKVV